MKAGTRVRQSEAFRAFVVSQVPEPWQAVFDEECRRDGVIVGGWRERLAEFDGCVGVVLGPVFPGDDPEAPGTWVDVRWEPSGLRYAYLPAWLIVEPPQ